MFILGVFDWEFHESNMKPFSFEKVFHAKTRKLRYAQSNKPCFDYHKYFLKFGR